MIFQLINEHIKAYGIEAEGINLISAASSCFKRDFRNRVEEYWERIIECLNQVKQRPLFKATLTCIADIARNQESHINQRISMVFSRLMDIMKSDVDR